MRGADELLEFHEIKLPQENAVFHFGSATGFWVEIYLKHTLKH